MAVKIEHNNTNTKQIKYETTQISKPNMNIGNKLNGANINGIIEHFSQGKTAGDCRLLSQLIALSHNKQGKTAIKNAVKSDGNGGAIVTFKGAKGNQKKFHITINEFLKQKNGNIYSKGDDDVLAIELAAVKYLKSQGIKIPSNGIQGHEVAELGENEFVGLLMGNDVRKYNLFPDSNNDIDVMNGLKELEKNPEKYIVTIGFRYDYNDEVHSAHAYSLKRIENKNGKKFIVFINPYNSTKEIKIEYNKLKNYEMNLTAYELNNKSNNRNFMRSFDRLDEKRQIEITEKELEIIGENKYKDRYGLLLYGNEYQIFTSEINYDTHDELKKYINKLGDLKRYLIMKNEAEFYIDKLDSRASGWGADNMKKKRDLIDPFIASVINEGKKYGLSQKAINKFKAICDKELNAIFYTNEDKIIDAFENIIIEIEKLKEEFYQNCD